MLEPFEDTALQVSGLLALIRLPAVVVYLDRHSDDPTQSAAIGALWTRFRSWKSANRPKSGAAARAPPRSNIDARSSGGAEVSNLETLGEPRMLLGKYTDKVSVIINPCAR